MSVDISVSRARAAIKSGDAAEARRLLDGTDPAQGQVLEAVAQVSYLELDYRRAIESWESAYSAYRQAGDLAGAVRVARTLAGMYFQIIGDGAIGTGWMARARTLLGDIETCEAGWVALNTGMFETNRVRKEEHYRSALAIARRYDDRDLELTTLSYLGASLVHGDRTEEGMILLDEALAGVAGGEVDDFCVLEEIFCQLFSACEHARDVGRADQWIRLGDAIARRRKLPAVSAFCRTHYGGVLTAAGRWPEAETTLNEAIRLWGLGERSGLRAGAILRLADLRVRQGRFDEAEELLADPFVHANDAARPLAAIHLDRGETTLAADLLERALANAEPGTTATVPLLALLVDVYLAADLPIDAANAAEQLVRCAAQHNNVYVNSVAALAQGQVCLAGANHDQDARACLRRALQGFTVAQTPMELADTRLALARAMQASRPEVALAEARAALEAYEQLDAARQVDAAAAMLRSLGVRPPSPRPSRTRPTSSSGLSSNDRLTKREAEVLRLVGQGLSNPDIAERLYISRKTVEHHVGNILAKLGLHNRTQAAAHAARMKPGSE